MVFSSTTEAFNQSTKGLHFRSRSCCTSTVTILVVALLLGDLHLARKCGTKLLSLTKTVLFLGVDVQPVAYWNRICLWVFNEVLECFFN